MDRIKRLRWQQRSLPESIKVNLSPQEIQVHHLLQHYGGVALSHNRHAASHPSSPITKYTSVGS